MREGAANQVPGSSRRRDMGLLVTGPEESLMAWQWDAMPFADLFDRRLQTVRVRLFGIDILDLDNPDWGKAIDPAKVQAQLARAIELAKKHDVTVQELVDSDGDETYPVHHVGTHGMVWPDYLPKSKKRGKK